MHAGNGETLIRGADVAKLTAPLAVGIIARQNGMPGKASGSVELGTQTVRSAFLKIIEKQHSGILWLAYVSVLTAISLLNESFSAWLISGYSPLRGWLMDWKALRIAGDMLGLPDWTLVYHCIALLTCPFISVLVFHEMQERVRRGQTGDSWIRNMARVIFGILLSMCAFGYSRFGGGISLLFDWHAHGRFVYALLGHLPMSTFFAVSMGIAWVGLSRLFKIGGK